jgi:hypothetical protein
MFKQKTYTAETLSPKKIQRYYLPLKNGRTSQGSELIVFSLVDVTNKEKHETMKRKQTSCISLTRVLFNITRRLPGTIRVQVFAL